MINDQHWTNLKNRDLIVRAIRQFFWQQHFVEVETPQLVPLPSMEPYLEVFETTLLDQNRQPQPAFLTSSPEYAMKKILADQPENIFQICKSYRNAEGASSRHNPEFTILEWYRPHADYNAIMQDCQNLLLFIGQQLGQTTVQYQQYKYDLTQPWERISVAEAFQKYAAVQADDLLDPAKLIAIAEQKKYQVATQTTWEEAYHQIFLNEVEPNLGLHQPTILYDYPAAMAALSKKKESDPRWSERFEFYLGGLEMGNAFSELTDAREQLTRLQADQNEKKRLGKTVFGIDQDFIAALEKGMPPTAGIAVGVDRLVMLFSNQNKIQNVLAFPATKLW